MSIVRRLGFGVMGALARPVRALSDNTKLRVLAYHDVSDVDAFERQVEYLAHAYEPVVPPFDGVPSSKDRRVWITFDDADPTVVSNALPVLQRYGITASTYVCPGLVDTEVPFWWETVEHARSLGISDGSIPDLRTLKGWGDPRRREYVASLGEMIRTRSGQFRRTQITSEQLATWMDSGNRIGNHSWDHPILSTCEPAVQESQIAKAHDWLVSRGMLSDATFAYPDGDATETAVDTLQTLGYEAALLFDHRVSSGLPSMSVSRIRVNASDSLSEFKAKVSGVHPALHRIRGGS